MPGKTPKILPVTPKTPSSRKLTAEMSMKPTPRTPSAPRMNKMVAKRIKTGRR